VRWGSTSLGALDVPQESPSNPTHDLTPSKPDDCAVEARRAEECIYGIDGLRGVRGGTKRQDDEQVEEDFRGNYERGKEVDGDGDDDQERGEEREENGFEDPDDVQKSC